MISSHQMDAPVIRVKRQARDEKTKKAGFFASLLSKLGLGGGAIEAAAPGIESVTAGASAGSGAGGSFIGAMMATKAGVLALALAGTTVAGVVGTLGPKLLDLPMPDRKAERGESFSLFPSSGKAGEKDASSPSADKPAPDGSSQSLDFLNSANRGQQPDGAAPQASDAGPAAPQAAPNHDAAPNASSAIQRPQLTANKGFSSLNASGSGAHFGTGGGAANASADLTQLGARGRSSPGSASRVAVTAGQMGRNGNGGRFGGALDQARMARNNVRSNLTGGNVSSPGSGTTYDGGRMPERIGPAGGPITGGGASNGGAGMARGQSQNPLTPNQQQQPPAPPITNPTDAAPWQGLVNAAIAALVIAGAALLAAMAARKTGNPGVAAIASGIAAAAGAMVTIIGMMLFATYGQQMMGGMWMAIGGIVTYFAVDNLIDDYGAYEKGVQQVAAGKAGMLEAQKSYFTQTLQNSNPDALNSIGGEVTNVESVDGTHFEVSGKNGTITMSRDVDGNMVTGNFEGSGELPQQSTDPTPRTKLQGGRRIYVAP